MRTNSSTSDGWTRAIMYKTTAILLLASAICIQSVQASSKPLPPHKRAHIPTNLQYTIVRKSSPQGLSHASRSLFGSFQHARASKRSTPPQPFQVLDGNVHQPEYSDTILVQFDVPQSSSSGVSDDNLEYERISMLLQPTEDLIHQNAKVVYTLVDPDTGLTSEREEPLYRDSVLAYSGVVLHEQDVAARLQAAKIGLRMSEDAHRGWARLLLSPPGSDSTSGKNVAEGAFQLNGEMHHLKSLDSYSRSRRYPEGYEAQIQARHMENNEGLVLLRDRDLEYGAFDLPSTVKRELFSQGLEATRPHGSSCSQGLEATRPHGSSCSHDSLAFNNDPNHPIHRDARQMAFDAQFSRKEGWLDSLMGITSDTRSHNLLRRQSGGDLAGGGNLSSNYLNSIGSHTGCPKSPQVLYMGLAADCTYTAHYGSQNATRTAMLTNMNTVSAIYKSTFNVSLGVVELNVAGSQCPQTANSSLPWNTVCPEGGSSGLNLNDRLSAFSQWRGNKGGGDGAGLWHLLTNCSTGSEVGVAWLGTLCKVSASTGSDGGVTSGTGVTSITDREYQVMAHEIGHNFGAIHDCADGCSLSGQCCPLTKNTCDANGAYIMSPVSEPNTQLMFSQCSLGNICSGLGTSLNTTCLDTPGDRTLISLKQCGNGILEPGEQCDPGQQSSSCCNKSTCQFKSGAVCDPITDPCCTSSCQYASTSQICRPAVNAQCDVAEYCSGSSGSCPEDKHQADGTSCGDNGLACANGYCTSQDEQCATLGSSMGITQACSQQQDNCQVTCQNPQSSGSCVILDGQSFVQGTPCGNGGRCDASGNCASGSWQDTVKGWIQNNERISIPVLVIGGLVVLLILFGLLRCLFNCCRRDHKAQNAKSNYYTAPAQAQQPMQQYSQADYAPPQQPYPTYGNGNGYNGYR